jgi:hypothetical protein
MSPTAEGSESPGLSYGRCTERTLLLRVFPRRLLSDLRFTSGYPRYAP